MNVCSHALSQPSAKYKVIQLCLWSTGFDSQLEQVEKKKVQWGSCPWIFVIKGNHEDGKYECNIFLINKTST